MNADYKFLTQTIDKRLRPLLADKLQPGSHCGIPGTTVFEAVATVREAIAHAEVTRPLMCILPLDFQEAFDKISRTYIFTMLKSYGFSESFIHRIKRMHENATSSIQINGHLSSPAPILCCPLSMQLFALCLNPLLHILEEKLPGIRVWRRNNKTAVVAYADDVTIFVTIPEDIPITRDAIQCYETASGAHLNIRKFKAMTIEIWNTNINIIDIPYYTDIKILGFNMARTVKQSACNSWSRIKGRVRAHARETYCRYLSLSQGTLYVNAFILKKVRYTAQIFPSPDEGVRQLKSVISWYI
jgi:hypothetical protein